MLWFIRYRLLCWLLRLFVRCGLDELNLQTVVLHHQLKVLRRGGQSAHVGHNHLGCPDRACRGMRRSERHRPALLR